jgi:hypothetical protein
MEIQKFWPIFIERARERERARRKKKVTDIYSTVSKKNKKIGNPEVLAYFHRRVREREKE